MSALSIATCSAVPIEGDEPKTRWEALLLDNNCIPGLAEEAKQLRAKVANMEKNALAKITPVIKKRRSGIPSPRPL